MRPRKTVIVITPSESLRNEYALQMNVWGYRTLAPATMDDAMDMVQAEQPDAVLCDRMADGMVQQLAAAAPESTGFVLVTENGRKVKDFNAILRERVKNAANRKPGPKKDSASAGLRTSLLTVAVSALLVAVALVSASGFQQRDVLSIIQVKLTGASAPTPQITNQVIGFRMAAFEQLPELLRGQQGPRPNRKHGMPLSLCVGHAELFVAGLNVSLDAVHMEILRTVSMDGCGSLNREPVLLDRIPSDANARAVLAPICPLIDQSKVTSGKHLGNPQWRCVTRANSALRQTELSGRDFLLELNLKSRSFSLVLHDIPRKTIAGQVYDNQERKELRFFSAPKQIALLTRSLRSVICRSGCCLGGDSLAISRLCLLAGGTVCLDQVEQRGTGQNGGEYSGQCLNCSGVIYEPSNHAESVTPECA